MKIIQNTWIACMLACASFVVSAADEPAEPAPETAEAVIEVAPVEAPTPNKGLTCPDVIFSDAQVIDMIKMHRDANADLPKAITDSTTRVARLRCLYVLFETSKEDDGQYQTITLDPYGEVKEYYQSDG